MKKTHFAASVFLDFDAYSELIDRYTPTSILYVQLTAQQGNYFTGYCSDKEPLLLGLQLCFSSLAGNSIQRFLQCYHEMRQ